MLENHNKPKPFFKSISGQTILGVFFGIIAGIIFGEDCAVLKPIGTIYASFLQIVVFPYMVCVMLSGLGKLSPEMSYKLVKRGWPFYIGLLLVPFILIGILTMGIPESISLQSDILEKTAPVDLISLLISNNIFNALSQNHLPAVVIFTTILALMLQRMNGTGDLLRDLDVISNACLEIWRILALLAPYAVFILMAQTAGSIKLNQIVDVGIYLFLFYTGTILLTFWIYPIIISCILPIRYKDLLLELRESLIIATTTTHAVLALPYIHNIVIKLIDRQEKIKDHDLVERVSNTNMIISYSFAHAGNFFVYLFIVFSALFFNHPLESTQKIWLPFVTYLSTIGSQSATITATSFLSQWLHLPLETTTLFISLLPLVSYFEVIVSVMSITFFTLVISWAYFHPIKIKKPLLLLSHLFAATLLLLCVIQIKNWVPDAAFSAYTRILNSELSPELTNGIKAELMPTLEEQNLKPDKNAEETLFRIQRTGILRVGYNENMMPFSFFNSKHQLVGYDIAFMYELARSLNASIEFIPYTLSSLASDIAANAFDIGVGGVYITVSRLASVTFTEPYLETSVSFIVPENIGHIFGATESIRKVPNLRIGMIDSPTLHEIMQKEFPKAQIILLKDTGTSFKESFTKDKLDAIIWTSARTRLWVLGHPGYITVTPKDLAAPLLLGYMLMQQANAFQDYIHFWLKLKEKEGFKDNIYRYWILARPKPDTKPRWSLIKDIFHWEK